MKHYQLRHPPPIPEIRGGRIISVLTNINRTYNIYIEGDVKLECDSHFFQAHQPAVGKYMVQTPDGAWLVLSAAAMAEQWEEIENPDQPDLLAADTHTTTH